MTQALVTLDLEGPGVPLALCKGDVAFTQSSREGDTARCLATCRICPELLECSRQLSEYRKTQEWENSKFTGVWAGIRFSGGRPSVRTVGVRPTNRERVVSVHI